MDGTMSFTPEILQGGKLIPVVVCREVDEAVSLANSLLLTGISCMEITLRSPCALEAISAIARHIPSMVVGAGTILTIDQLESARQAGARFMVSPGMTLDLLSYAKDRSLPYVPGVSTCSEIMTALSYGYSYLKLFPASQVGGTSFLKALSGPFPEVRFCPTGGITEATVGEYLALPQVFAVGGSWMVPRPDTVHRDLQGRSGSSYCSSS
jgi:2-dehydro-3-deoxyphosphogluconate aldolase/(4S)-4-hydroxy-2-oxoglutarate aldolase